MAEREDLLHLAVRHELGHALCSEVNERQADRVEGVLKEKQPVACKIPRLTNSSCIRRYLLLRKAVCEEGCLPQ
jgi:hypothetical protein